MKKLKTLTAILCLIVLVFSVAPMTAFALSDIDFTLKPPTEEIAPNESFTVDFVINTQTVNGYVDFTVEIEYNDDVLKCTAVIDEDGFTGGGSQGIYELKYSDPTGMNTPSPIGETIIKIPFTVLEAAPGGETQITGNVKECFGVDKNGNKVNITTAKIYNKKIFISDIAAPVSSESSVEPIPESYTDIPESGYDINSYAYGDYDDEGPGAGTVFGYIVGIIAIFAVGAVAGYFYCQKKLDSSVGRGTYRRNLRTFSDGRNDVEAEDDDDDELPTFGAPASKRTAPSRRPLNSADDDDDFSYFGRAGEMPIGDYSSRASGARPQAQPFAPDDDDESGFPDSFFPRNYAGRTDNRTDDGFGAYTPGSFGTQGGRGASRDSASRYGQSGSFGGFDDTDSDDFSSFGGGDDFGMPRR